MPSHTPSSDAPRVFGDSTADPAPERSRPDDTRSTARRWWVLAVVVTASVMDQLDTTVTYVAAPSVQADIGGGPSTVQWLAAGYTLAFAVFLIVGGRLGDIYGRRRMFLLGAAGFTLASVACGIAATPTQLIAARVAQGAFGALLIPQGLGVIKAVFPPRELGAAFGAFAPAMGIASVAGPVLAGGLIDADLFGTGWRMVFLINLPIGLVALAFAAVLLPRSEERQPIRLDLVGAAMVTVGAVLVIYPLVQGRAAGWPPWTWVMLLAGVLVFGLFAVYERRTGRDPIIEPSLLRNRTYLGGLAVVVVFFGVVAGHSLVLNLYAQTTLHFSPLIAGITTGIPFSAGIAVASVFANRLIPRFGRVVLHGGMALMIGGLDGLAAVAGIFGLSLSFWALMLPTAVIGFGMGFVFGPLFRAVLGGVRQREVGSASGTIAAVQQFGGTLGVAGITTAYFALATGISTPMFPMVATALFIAALVAVAFGLVFVLPAHAPTDSR